MAQHRWSNDLRRVWQRLIRRVAGRDERPVIRVDAKPALARLPATFADAVRTLADQATVRGLPFRKRALWDTTWSNPETIRFANALCAELQQRGFPMFVVQGFRSWHEQAALLERGVTRAGPGQSAHNHGMAVDVIHFKRGWNLTRKEWAVIGAVGKDVARRLNLAVTWGGDWSFWDPAHWELADWRERIER